MIINIMKYVLQDIDMQREMLSKCNELLKQMPKGGLTSQGTSKRRYYKMRINGKQKYLSVGDPMIDKLKSKYLVEKLIKRLTGNIELLEEFAERYQSIDPNMMVKGFKKTYRDMPLEAFERLGFIDADRWASSGYIKNDRYKESLNNTTSSGLKVRSRAEVNIADTYDSKGIPFRYEEVLELPDGTVLNPDFHVLVKSENRTKYHEHVGMLNDIEYMKMFIWKLLFRQ